MPTAYTAPVKSGKVSDFPSFALLCARAFGALIEMREDALDKPIPRRFEPSRYHAEAFASSNELMKRLLSRTEEDWRVEADKDFSERVANYQKGVAERKDERLRYQAMLDAAKAWTPPTTQHSELKQFMIQQLSESIDWDCSDKYDRPPERMTVAQYRAKTLADAARSIEYHEGENRKEIERTESRNKWLDDLRASLGIALDE